MYKVSGPHWRARLIDGTWRFGSCVKCLAHIWNRGKPPGGTSSFYHRWTDHVVLMESGQIVKVEHPPLPPPDPLSSLSSPLITAAEAEKKEQLASLSQPALSAQLSVRERTAPGERAALTREKNTPAKSQPWTFAHLDRRERWPPDFYA